MLCEHCKKREATVKYVEVINGVKTEHNLCAQCAAHIDIGQYSALFEGEFPLGKLLSGLLGIEDPSRTNGQYAGVVCPRCGTTYEEFVKNSRFGCEDCYSVFDPLLGDHIRRLQGSGRHVGKKPADWEARMEESLGERKDLKAVDENAGEKAGETEGENAVSRSSADRIRMLELRLKDALRKEDYEQAAALRDEIRELKEQTEKGAKEETTQNGEMV